MGNITPSFNAIISLKLSKVFAHVLFANIVAIETLRISMRKRPLANLNTTLLDRLIRTGLLNICFTERQKLSLVHVSGTSSPTTTNLFHQSMLELNLMAVGQTSEPPTVSSSTLFSTYPRLQALIPILSELLASPPQYDGMVTMKMHANTELAVISRGVARLRVQSMRREDGLVVGGGKGMSILPHRFNPGVGLSQVVTA